MRRTALALAIAAALAAVGTARAAGGPQEDLAACGAIADPTERLACYDRVAGRPATPVAPAAGVPKAAPAAPQSVAPAQAAAVPAQAATPPAQAQGAAAAASFGSYRVEHPVSQVQVAETLTAHVSAMGKTIDGQPTVTLEGGALWLLDEVDPLLAVGDTVTIKRGVLGSFLLETATRRVHHVRRIR
jgi:hypothetical protein